MQRPLRAVNFHNPQPRAPSWMFALAWRRVVFMGLILFLHGMGHDPRKDYWRDWAGPLREALVREGVKVAESNFGGIYYYDLVPGPAAENRAGDFFPERRQYLDQLKEFAWQELGSAEKILPLPTRSLIKQLVSYILDNFGDILTYLHCDLIYQAVNWRVFESLLAAGRPVYLLGYSLGAMVGYCALQASPPLAGRVVHFMMLGNPLFWFADGVARRADLRVRPAVGRWTNLAGVLDIAWPHLVPRLVRGLDEHVEFIIDRFNPIRGHRAYFTNPASLHTIARVIAGTWQN
ncbi:MAG: hypothetical protein AB1523_06660 [Bacillota bacterium]